MHILGIETSCDETAAAVVSDGRQVKTNVVATSLKEHQKYGGIIPEIASRHQLELIGAVVNTALEKAKLTFNSIDAIAVTRQPGLIGSLLVGLSYARALSFATGKPLLEIDHIEAHIYANFLRTSGDQRAAPTLPAIGLVVSGGHSSLFLVKTPAQFELIGQTRDDAAGEAFDKVARLLELGYPGGPVIDRLAKTVTAADSGIRFNPAELTGSFDFSFSGVKTAVLYHQQKHSVNTTEQKAVVVQAFQESVVDILVRKSIKACQHHRCATLLVGGGVAANTRLREQLNHAAAASGITVHVPPMEYCLDNAAMIAGLGFHRQAANQTPRGAVHG